MKLTRGARALILIGMYRRIVCRELKELRRRLAAGQLTTRQLKVLQDSIEGNRSGMAFYEAVLRRIYDGCAAA